ncbi:hypothetical protein T492DRAFT_1151381 [Pavlovales sp. CCMP2436]|nr:hypothetical protein T492DRAFT_1151381 [Pavlovales sp. CCMP2436]
MNLTRDQLMQYLRIKVLVADLAETNGLVAKLNLFLCVVLVCLAVSIAFQICLTNKVDSATAKVDRVAAMSEMALVTGEATADAVKDIREMLRRFRSAEGAGG